MTLGVPHEDQGFQKLHRIASAVLSTWEFVTADSSGSLANSEALLSVSLMAQMVKNLPAMQETRIRSLHQENPLKQGMATHSSILAWRLPGKDEPGGLQSMGSQRVRHDWTTLTLTFTQYFPTNPEFDPEWFSKKSQALGNASLTLSLVFDYINPAGGKFFFV